MRIGIVGGGAAGLTTAWLLQADHDVVVFESSNRPGGHARTMVVEDGRRDVLIEVGAQFVFDSGYSGLLALIDRLGLTPIRERLAMSFITSDGRTIVVPPLRARALATYASPRTLRDLFWFSRFLAVGVELVREGDWSVTVEQWIERARVPRESADLFIVPFIAASWGVPRELAVELSAYSVRKVIGLDAMKLPHAVRLPRGLSSYIDRLVEDSPRATVRLGTPVRDIELVERAVRVHTEGQSADFDAVVLACDWHNSAALCEGAPQLSDWARAFRAFDDYPVRIAVHRDSSLMPTRREHWETGNFFLSHDAQPRNTLWSGKPVGAEIFRSWMRPNEPEPRETVDVVNYRHVAVTPAHPRRQAAVERLQGSRGIFAAGMYTNGVDNHESALRSALSVARRIAPNAERVGWLAARISP